MLVWIFFFEHEMSKLRIARICIKQKINNILSEFHIRFVITQRENKAKSLVQLQFHSMNSLNLIKIKQKRC